MMTSRFFVCAALVAVLVTAHTSSVWGQTWDGDAADGLWHSPTNWSTNNVPVSGGITNIGSASVPNPMVTLTGSNGAVGQLYIGNNSGANAVLIIDGVNLGANNQVQAGKVSGATGTISLINGGTITNSSQIGAGSASGTTGFINLASGTSITTGTVVSGQFGVGTGKYTVTLDGTALFRSNSELRTRNATTAVADWTGIGRIESGGSLKADARFTADGGELRIRLTGGGGQYQRDLAINQGDTGSPAQYQAGTGGKKSGYYAINGGTLVLEGNSAWGALGNSNQTLPYTYGDRLNGGLSTQLAVNSVNFLNLTNVTNSAHVHVEIQDQTLITGVYAPVSVYNINNQDNFITNATGIQIRFRYNDFGLASGPESTLKLFSNFGSGWSLVSGFTLDTTNKWMTSPSLAYNVSGTNAMGMFAVAQAMTPLAAYWTGDQGGTWTTVNSGNSNWATSSPGTTDTEAPPGSVSDVFFTATGAANLNTTLGADFAVNSVTFSSASPVSVGGSNLLTIGTGGIAVQTGSANPTLSTNIALGASQTWTVTDAASELAVSGNVSGGAANSLTKSGSGILILSGANTYTGPTNIDAGTLLVNGDNSAATGAVTVATGATLGGTGIIGGNTVIHGIHSPGNSPGIQTFVGNLSYEADPDAPIVEWELIDNTVTNQPNPNALFDTIVVGGTLDFSDPTALDLIFDAAGSLVDWTDSFWAVSHLGTSGWLLYDVAGATTNFDNLSITPENWLDGNALAFDVVRPGSSFSLYQDGNDIYLNFAVSAIPEPSTYALGLLGLIGLGVVTWRRRRLIG